MNQPADPDINKNAVNTAPDATGTVPPQKPPESQLNLIDLEPEGRNRKLVFGAAIVLLALVAIGGYIVYRYFAAANQDQTQNGNAPVAGVTVEPSEESSDTSAPSQPPKIDLTPRPGDYEGIIPGTTIPRTPAQPLPSTGVKGSPAPTQPAAPAAPAQEPSPAPAPQAQTPVQTSYTGSWKANDYKHGDIKTNKYTVILGDTLWEISEGFYGNGRKWIEVAKANAVKYLMNGNPLIMPGQILNLP